MITVRAHLPYVCISFLPRDALSIMIIYNSTCSFYSNGLVVENQSSWTITPPTQYSRHGLLTSNLSENVRKYIKYCVMSHLKDIFSWAIDYAHRSQTSLVCLSIGQPREIQWTFTSHLENIAYTDHQLALFYCPTRAPLYRRNIGKDQKKSLRSLVP